MGLPCVCSSQSNWACEASPTLGCSIEISRVPRVYESRTNQALVHNYFIARKYCVLSRYVSNNYINVFPANTFFNDAYQTISDIQFIAMG